MPPPKLFLDRFSFRRDYLAARSVKADKILAVLRREGHPAHSAAVLDIGCSQGHITDKLAGEFGFVVGIDPDYESNWTKLPLPLVQGSGTELPFRGSAFDIVVLNHVIEHVRKPQQLLDEIRRVLRPGGICYLACPNRFILIEPHYRLPFLSWLPRGWAHTYVRLARRGEAYDDSLPTYWQLRKWARGFHWIDYTLEIVRNPGLFLKGDTVIQSRLKWLRPVPQILLRTALPWFPVFVAVLRKPASEHTTESVGLKTSGRKESLAAAE
ncbi:MAG: class I SAM-dependent methyltransferase [Acidobacteriota bacterium]